jgi:hypothetical protein
VLATPRPSPVRPGRPAVLGPPAASGCPEAAAGPSPSADRGTTELRPLVSRAPAGRVRRVTAAPRGAAVAAGARSGAPGPRSRIDRHVTVNSELARTRGIRLSN